MGLFTYRYWRAKGVSVLQFCVNLANFPRQIIISLWQGPNPSPQDQDLTLQKKDLFARDQDLNQDFTNLSVENN